MTHMNLISTLSNDTYCYTFLRTKIKYAKKKETCAQNNLIIYATYTYIYIINDIRISSQ